MNANNNPHEPEEQRERQVRERQVRQAQDTQTRRERQKTQAVLNRNLDEIRTHVQKGIAAQTRGKIKSDRLQRLEYDSPSYANAGPLATMGHCTFALGAIAVVLLNYFLINAPVNYLASTPFEDEKAWQVRVSTVVVPILLLVFELCISLGRRHAMQTQDANVRAWETAGTVMILVAPLLIVGTMFAREDWWAAYNLTTSLAMIILAGVTDALIVYGGEQIYNAQAFVWFHYCRWRIQRDINYFDSQYRKAGRNVERFYIRFAQVLNDYNDRHPNHPLNAGPFSRDTALFINKWFRDQVIILPPETREDETPAAPVRPHPNPPNPNLPNAEVDVEAQTQAERDYYRQLLDNQVRNNEREVQPD
ncbi:hypothetical protein CDG77_28535 [Nostoc sp. 'Peltigera membranacea cyanobiont' 213]|uniref:hypothetical protein n=1 Tax=Nostoc sp. 'Peltigera membranacea cyanobiont' 213 TaxID=2014530 RepID=UPI000B95A049|nr:hypothetical protein [Nostoc sp. 'Peltigera membranacea cyanobiont' 213]OYD87588.1 hypothetical protein CDG77_28535 [Nostoc sp. 'Peltigera membranacea cyanobiont' 213]